MQDDLYSKSKKDMYKGLWHVTYILQHFILMYSMHKIKGVTKAHQLPI